MKRIFLWGLLLSCGPFQTQASVEGGADGKDIAIVVLACASAFVSGTALVWCWYTKTAKRDLQYDLAHVQGELERTQGQLQEARVRLDQLAQQVQRTNPAEGDRQHRVLAVRQAAFVQLQRATGVTGPEEIWANLQYGGPPPAYDSIQVASTQSLPSGLPPGIAETDLSLPAQSNHDQNFGEEA